MKELIPCPLGYKQPTDSTLKKMTKKDLVEYIRMLEHNWSAEYESSENKTKILTDIVYSYHCPNCGRKLTVEEVEE